MALLLCRNPICKVTETLNYYFVGIIGRRIDTLALILSDTLGLSLTLQNDSYIKISSSQGKSFETNIIWTFF